MYDFYLASFGGSIKSLFCSMFDNKWNLRPLFIIFHI